MYLSLTGHEEDSVGGNFAKGYQIMLRGSLLLHEALSPSGPKNLNNSLPARSTGQPIKGAISMPLQLLESLQILPPGPSRILAGFLCRPFTPELVLTPTSGASHSPVLLTAFP